MLKVIGVYIAYDERVFQKVLKVVAHAANNKPEMKQVAI